MGSFFGSIILEFIGALFRWLLTLLLNKIRKRKTPSFGRIWNGRKGASFQQGIEHGGTNIFIGMLVVLVIVVILSNLI